MCLQFPCLPLYNDGALKKEKKNGYTEIRFLSVSSTTDLLCDFVVYFVLVYVLMQHKDSIFPRKIAQINTIQYIIKKYIHSGCSYIVSTLFLEIVTVFLQWNSNHLPWITCFPLFADYFRHVNCSSKICFYYLKSVYLAIIYI